MKEKDNQKTLTRNDLAQSLYTELGAYGDSYRFVTTFFEVLSDSIIKNEEVKIHGFGKFRCLDKKPRLGRNPKTGEEVEIGARRVVSFVAGGKFKHEMAQGEDGGKD